MKLRGFGTLAKKRLIKLSLLEIQKPMKEYHKDETFKKFILRLEKLLHNRINGINSEFLMNIKKRIIVALDSNNFEKTNKLIDEIKNYIFGVKIGYEFFLILV